MTIGAFNPGLDLKVFYACCMIKDKWFQKGSRSLTTPALRGQMYSFLKYKH
jgi:hypothetical protein